MRKISSVENLDFTHLTKRDVLDLQATILPELSKIDVLMLSVKE